MSDTTTTASLADPAARRALMAGVEAEPGSSKPDSILDVDNIVRHFGGITAVDVAHLEVQRGIITALIGPNGAGKTTFFNLITGFDRPTSAGQGAHWSFDGRTLDKTSASRVARSGMVRTFQLTKALSRMTVMENMMLGAQNQAGENLAKCLLRRSGAARRSRSRRRRWSCSTGSACWRSAPTTPARSPVASASCWRWRAR